MSPRLFHCHFVNMRVRESKRGLINFIFFVVRKAFDFNFLFTNYKYKFKANCKERVLLSLLSKGAVKYIEPALCHELITTGNSQVLSSVAGELRWDQGWSMSACSSAFLSRIHTSLFWCRGLQFKGLDAFDALILLGCSILPSALLFVKDGLLGLSTAHDTLICSLAFLVPNLGYETKTSSHNCPSLALGLGYP